MKKMPTLFQREFDEHHRVTIHNTVTNGCEWVLNGEGNATRKFDGTCTMVQNGHLFRRYDAKRGKPLPPDAIPCQELPDPITLHWPCWVPVDPLDKSAKWMVKAFEAAGELPDGTYEFCGPHVNGNPEGLESDQFIRHGCVELTDVPRTFEGIREYLQSHEMEGIVFHRQNGEMCKIKRTDFQIPWNNCVSKRGRA